MPGPFGHGPRHSGKEKFNVKAFKKIIRYCKPFMAAVILAFVCAIIGAVASIIAPGKIGDLMNEITGGIFTGIDMSSFMDIVIFLIVLCCVGAIFNYLQQYIMAIVTQKVSKKLRSDIDKKINILPLSYFDKTTKGDILSRVTNDVDTIAQSLGSSTANLISSLVLFVGVVIMMFKTNWILALVTIGASLFGFLFISLLVSKSQKYFNRRQKCIGDLNGHIEEIYTNHETVKSYNAYDNEKKEFAKLNNNIYNTTWKAQFMSSLMGPIMNFVGDFSYVAIFVVGVSIIVSGGTGVTLGTLMSFIIYAKQFSQPLTTFAQSLNSIQQASAAGGRVFEMLEEKQLLDESGKKAKLDEASVKGDVEFRNVRFAYQKDKTIIKNFSANLSAGQKVAIVGPTGAGKTTMVNLLMRFYELREPRLIVKGKITDYKIFDNGKSIRLCVDSDGELYVNDSKTEYVVSCDTIPKDKVIKFNQNFDICENDEIIDGNLPVVVGNGLDNPKDIELGIAYYGDIFIDNVPTKSLTRENIHELFDMILQDTWLFHGTVRQNLIYNAKDVSDERLQQVCDAVGLTHFINTLPKGFDTVLDNIDSLSEGQKQQLTIARAMIKDSPLLILDEATSNVDTRTELVIQEAMDKLTKGRTSFVIAHRLSTIKNADVILVMKDGDIIEKGSHKELLEKNGFYAELYNSQFVQVG
ncbi:MAG: ABC transporter ATP-binding protein [Christensenellales bacterium]